MKDVEFHFLNLDLDLGNKTIVISISDKHVVDISKKIVK